MAVPGDLNSASILAEVDELEILVEKLIAGGDGFARHNGVPIFVPLAVPGDRLRVVITKRAAQYVRASILEVLEPGPGRRVAPCPHFDVCGGCDLQHIEDELQAGLKVAAARETLERLGGQTLPASRLVVGASWGYRGRAQLQTSATDSERGRLGYFVRGSHEVVDIGECRVLAPELEQWLETLRAGVSEDSPRRLDVAVGDHEELTRLPILDGQPRGPVQRTIGGIEYSFDAGTFFQGHVGLLRDLVDAVCGQWTGDAAYDLYAGVGLFTLPLASRYKSVVAVESQRAAARYARLKVRRNRALNVEIVARVVETWIQDLPHGVDRVVLNPPRAGLSAGVSMQLTRRAPQRLTYLSCHAATLARDLKVLEARFDIESLDFFDLFPQTGHIEALVQLVAR